MKLFCKLKTLWNDFKSRLSRAEKVGLILLVGCIAGLGSLFLYTLRFTTYLGDDPAACMNCHVMAPYYATWAHSSHAHTAQQCVCKVLFQSERWYWTRGGLCDQKRERCYHAQRSECGSDNG